MRRLLFPHLALWVLGAALVRIALIPPEVCPAVGAAEVTDAAVAASEWIDRGTGADGRYTYGYLKDRDTVPVAYNAVRHAGAVFTMYQMSAAGHDRFLATAAAGTSQPSSGNSECRRVSPQNASPVAKIP